MHDHEGISLDSTYTAKTFAAVMAYCRHRRMQDESILYWHTYNSVDLSNQAREIDFRKLPHSLQSFFE